MTNSGISSGLIGALRLVACLGGYRGPSGPEPWRYPSKALPRSAAICASTSSPADESRTGDTLIYDKCLQPSLEAESLPFADGSVSFL